MNNETNIKLSKLQDTLDRVYEIQDSIEVNGMEIPPSLYKRERELRKEIERIEDSQKAPELPLKAAITLEEITKLAVVGDPKAKQLLDDSKWDALNVLAALREVAADEPGYWDCLQVMRVVMGR